MDPHKSQRKLIDLTQVLEVFGPCREPDFATLVMAADEGQADAQNDLGMVLLREGKEAAAIKLFQESAQQGYADAMHWLYLGYMKGLGVEANEHLALMWLNKAAAYGHVIALEQTKAISSIVARQLAVGLAR